MDECTSRFELLSNISISSNGEPPPGNGTRSSANFTAHHRQLLSPEATALVLKASEAVEDLVYHNVIVAICAFGLVGNVVNLIVLSRRSLTRTMERMERSAHYGLMGLAVSDALLCASVLPTAYVGNRVFGFRVYDFRIVYATYGNSVINTFILSSTWLTVTMALGRYLAICHPFHARLVIGKRYAVTSLTVVFCACAVLNLPRYFVDEIKAIACQEGGSFYYKDSGLLGRRKVLCSVYFNVYFFVSIVVPFLLLVFCNSNLIRALHTSMSMCTAQQQRGHVTSGGNASAAAAANRITLTLIVIVAMFLFLVVPTETLTFVRDTVIRNVEYLEAYNLAQAFLNLFQAVNFAFNFLLYCVVNSQFRKTLWRLVVTLVFCRRRRSAYVNYSSPRCCNSASKFSATSSSRHAIFGKITLQTSAATTL